ncbi:TPA: type-F conjugative transfer system protein TraW [Legionella pneumophila]|nr:type-F conjugative transfer system protein TraW [Legionella pneumophila]HAU0349934.1 type-F conjugative transfer system protein TraW [Legionella pneumophila]HAU0353425.1 type-F conjugative transfer system protein TraW [Legionella pneumophila]HAU0359514.1 type-F conjugative transfer system protein TraW [Legionella pneumophila]HAU0368071.1 type-F conjugative transfer system protein TraW [Legionella pneumophila]
MKIRRFTMFGILLTCLNTHGSQLGNYGAVFPIIEQDIRQVIFNKLHSLERSGELKEHQKRIISRVEAHVRRPNPVELSTTNAPKVYEIDPSMVVNQNLYTHDGKLIAQAGTKLNPFERINFSKTLFFFNADDPKQIAWVKNHYQQYEQVKFILTDGDVKEASKILGAIYFDLEGRLSNYFHLQHVPAVIRQEKKVWKIQEIGQKELSLS